MIRNKREIIRTCVNAFDELSVCIRQGIKAAESGNGDYALDYLYKAEQELDRMWMGFEMIVDVDAISDAYFDDIGLNASFETQDKWN